MWMIEFRVREAGGVDRWYPVLGKNGRPRKHADEDIAEQHRARFEETQPQVTFRVVTYVAPPFRARGV